MCEYLERDRNHPCVVDWSICNESDYGRVFSMAQRKMKSLDPTRIYSATCGDDTLDVDVYHHPITLQRIKDTLGRCQSRCSSTKCSALSTAGDDMRLFEDIDPGMRDYWIDGPAGNPAGAQRRREPGRRRAILLGRRRLSAFPAKAIGCWRRGQPPIRYTESVYKLPKRGHDRRRRLGNGGRLAASPARVLALEEALLARADRGEAARHSRSRQADRRSGRKLEPVRRSGPIRLPLGNGRRERRSPRQGGADEQRHA